jgi:hypothetical protein
MLGRFFSNAKQMDLLPAAWRNKMERIAAPLARTEGTGGFDLSGHMKKALDLLEDASAHGAKNLDDVIGQGGMFENRSYSPEAAALAKNLLKRNPNDLTNAVRQYVDAADYAKKYTGPGMFGDYPAPKTPAEAFDASFGDDALAAEAQAKAAAKAAKAAADKAGKESSGGKSGSGRTLKGAIESKGPQTGQK